jgi:hypothetical protein
MVPMLIDTGADETCFPASFAVLFGHDNKHPDVQLLKDSCQGIGGSSDAFVHSVRISLVDPVKSTKKAMVLAWSHTADKAPFVEKLDCPMGLLGMDIIKEWKELNFAPSEKGLWIRITV